MDAFFRGILLIGAISSLGATVSLAATVRTPNFVVNAPTAEFAKQVGEAAEIYRRELATDWLGAPLPGNWEHPCPISVVVGAMGAGGKTTFNFQNGEVYGWKMEVKGSEQRILDSVLPHEINHTIFASHFRRPLPRWADEGAASLIEHESERNQLRQIHSRAINTRRKIALRNLLEIKQYPNDQQELLTLYAEGHSLADYLIQRSGKREYIRLMEVAYDRGWETALKTIYGYNGVDSLEREWDQWVVQGSPQTPRGTQLASNDRSKPAQATIRGQSPDGFVKLGEPTQLTPTDSSRARELQDAIELSSNSAKPRNRTGLEQPLLTVNRTTTDAAKVSRE